VAITDAGNTKLDEALNVHLEYLDESLAKKLTESERVTLASLLTKLNATR
jgi:DNA-binding MarR family transcriptional regulator